MFNNLLIPIDLSHQEQLPVLIRAALKLANENGSTELNFVYVDDSRIHQGSFSPFDASQSTGRRHDIRDRMVALLRNLVPADVHYRCHIKEGAIHEQVLEMSSDMTQAAIVLMASRPGLSSYFVGSNAERIVRHSQCSVFVVRE